MKCPVCSIDLSMTDRQGVEIDYCPKCRGVWLDRGELDKLIERSDSPQRRPEQSDRHHHDDYSRQGEHQISKDRKRQGFLGRMLDFD
jgi:uncharacterized protein